MNFRPFLAVFFLIFFNFTMASVPAIGCNYSTQDSSENLENDSRTLNAVKDFLLRIQNDDRNKSSKIFVTNDAGEDPQVFFFGESHVSSDCLIENINKIEALIKDVDNDVLLLEGGDFHEQTEFGIKEILFNVYVTWEFEETGEKYDPVLIQNFSDKHNLEERFNNAFNLCQDLVSKLKLSKIKIGYWDSNVLLNQTKNVIQKNETMERLIDNSYALNNGDKYAEKIGKLRNQYIEVNRNLLRGRNSMMIKAIESILKKGHRVFVKAGCKHIPTGELMVAKEFAKTEVPDNLEKYYSNADKICETNYKFLNFVGTTEVVYKYLKENNISYSEYINKRVLTPYSTKYLLKLLKEEISKKDKLIVDQNIDYKHKD